MPPGPESPTGAVGGTVNKVFGVLEDPALKDPAKLISRRGRLERVIADRFDIQ